MTRGVFLRGRSGCGWGEREEWVWFSWAELGGKGVLCIYNKDSEVYFTFITVILTKGPTTVIELLLTLMVFEL
jgi:hypothetical protein